MWDLYNEPGSLVLEKKSFTFLEYVWNWAHEIRPSQPLTFALMEQLEIQSISLNKIKSDRHFSYI